MDRAILRGVNPDLRGVLLALRGQGWSIGLTRGGHFKLAHSETGAIVFSSKTPSCRRNIDNLQAQCRRELEKAASMKLPSDVIPTDSARNPATSAQPSLQGFLSVTSDRRGSFRKPRRASFTPDPAGENPVIAPDIATAAAPDILAACFSPAESSSAGCEKSVQASTQSPSPSEPIMTASPFPASGPSALRPDARPETPERGRRTRNDADRPASRPAGMRLPRRSGHRGLEIPSHILPDRLAEIFRKGLEASGMPFLVITPEMVGSLLVKFEDEFRLVTCTPWSNAPESSMADDSPEDIMGPGAHRVLTDRAGPPVPGSATEKTRSRNPGARLEAILKVLRIARETGGDEDWVSSADIIEMARAELASSGSILNGGPATWGKDAWRRSFHDLLHAGRIEAHPGTMPGGQVRRSTRFRIAS